MAIKKDIVGKRFGKLVVLDDYQKIPNGTKWKCLCDCGNETFVYRGKLTTGATKSCGCLNKSLKGLSDHKLYSVWSNIKDRCYNENNHAYENYGGKGVKLGDEWKEFTDFYNWSMANGYKEGLTIDRINADGDYSPNNCEWITLGENVARANAYTNRRKPKYLYYGISPNGIKHTFSNASEFAKQNGMRGTSITRVVSGERNSYRGWKFGFTDIPNI